MTRNVKVMSIKLLDTIWRKIFKEPIKPSIIEFFQNVSWLTIGMFISGIFGFSANAIMGRFLGPGEYGNFALATSASQFMIIPMLLGFNTAAIKYISEDKSNDSYLNTSLFIIALLTTSTTFLLILFQGPLQEIFHITKIVFIGGILLSIYTTFYWLAQAYFSAYNKFKLLAILEIIGSAFLLISFLIFIFVLKYSSFMTFLVAQIINFSILIIGMFYFFRKKINFHKVQRKTFRILFVYARIALFGGISGFILNNIDRIMINAYLDEVATGIYASYFYISTFFIMKMSQVMVSVFFPKMCASKGRGAIIQKLIKITPMSILLLTLFNIITLYIILQIYGEKYPTDLILMILFAINSAISAIVQLFMWALNSQGVEGNKLTVRILLVMSIVNIIGNMLLIPIIKIHGAITATLFINIVFLVYFWKTDKKFFVDQKAM